VQKNVRLYQSYTGVEELIYLMEEKLIGWIIYFSSFMLGAHSFLKAYNVPLC